eukprot:TRINITY_DN5767_c0_g1_i1.p1 TRINITY_DN5767_c0_g1~~TRINITY_DN5767_c0_g1_i1.p1  ORF type:complete len:454 (-),score=100.88 TRINITY_DN5767_c0_g1_i1:23-1384(-)
MYRKLLVVLLVCYATSVIAVRTVGHRRAHIPRASDPVPQYFDFVVQKLDHENPNDGRTWTQRYSVISDYYKPGNPVFIFLAGEAPMEFFTFQEVAAVEWAQQFGALYISLEHRFYGGSNPLPDLSSDNLRYLSSKQALADAAFFIKTFKSVNVTGPWVVFGCSYSGALSSWFRLLYPDLVVASVAPSGPVEAKLNFTEYFAWFQQIAPADCVTTVRVTAGRILQLLQTSSGRGQLQTIFNTCEPIDADPYNFLLNVLGAVGASDQFENPPDWPLNSTCESLMNAADPLTAWGALASPPGSCTSYSEAGMLQQLRNTTAPNENRSWYWQTCREFGYYQSAYPGQTIFNFDLPVERQVRWCEDIFGIAGMTPDVDGTNAYYGGKGLNATNVLFTNGMFDPWHLLSITEPSASGGVAASVYAAGHCASVTASYPTDPDSLTQTRQDVIAFLKTVLQ